MRVLALLALCFAAVAAVPSNPQRIVGGSVTTISQYPSIASLLYTWDFNTYSQRCGGIILNNRSILSAAHCTFGDPTNRWRIRIGSSWANSGGAVYIVGQIINHPQYNGITENNDICILRSATAFALNNNAFPASIAGANYYVGDNQAVWAAGWGDTYQGSNVGSEQLRHVQVVVINQITCRNAYAVRQIAITDNMLCSGWPNGGRDQCQGDSGGPLYHNGVVVGVCSFGFGCAQAAFPGVNTRVSRYTAWIQSNA
uniref:Trypsin IIb2 n=1 Tax=Sesamia nonagrioides TaxID=236805 RepID=Q4L1L9_9NEOP|nr:trypsin IIb2 precursor [Sesamia nonagrioides]